MLLRYSTIQRRHSFSYCIWWQIMKSSKLASQISIGETTLCATCFILHVVYQQPFDKSFVGWSPWDRISELRLWGSWPLTMNVHRWWGCGYSHICGSIDVLSQCICRGYLRISLLWSVLQSYWFSWTGLTVWKSWYWFEYWQVYFLLDSYAYIFLHLEWIGWRFAVPLSGCQVSDTGWFQVRRVVRKLWFSQILVACMSDYEDCMAMDIEFRLKMRNRIVCQLEFHTLVVELYCVRN